MLFRPSTKTKIRNAAIGAGIITLAAVSAFPAAAEQKTMPVAAKSEPITVDTDCHKRIGVDGVFGDAKCEIIRGDLLDAQAKMLATQNSCIAELVKFKKADPDKFKAMEFGNITRATACEAVARIPKPTANASPRVGG